MSAANLSSPPAPPVPISSSTSLPSEVRTDETTTSAAVVVAGSSEAAISSSSTTTCGCASVRSRPSRGLHLSRNPQDLLIPVSVFCKAFPFHFLCDQELRLLQIGSGNYSFTCSHLSPAPPLSILTPEALMRFVSRISSSMTHKLTHTGLMRLLGSSNKFVGSSIKSFFVIEQPPLHEVTFDSILGKTNVCFVIRNIVKSRRRRLPASFRQFTRSTTSATHSPCSAFSLHTSSSASAISSLLSDCPFDPNSNPAADPATDPTTQTPDTTPAAQQQQEIPAVSFQKNALLNDTS